jgi:hypothetical protein
MYYAVPRSRLANADVSVRGSAEPPASQDVSLPRFREKTFSVEPADSDTSLLSSKSTLTILADASDTPIARTAQGRAGATAAAAQPSRDRCCSDAIVPTAAATDHGGRVSRTLKARTPSKSSCEPEASGLSTAKCPS